MPNLIKAIGITLFLILILFSLSFAEETLTITTYYPSPYGSYNELTTSSNTYLATSGGNVGIGTTAPGAKLHVYKSGGSTLAQFESQSANSEIALTNSGTAADLQLTLNQGSGGTTRVIGIDGTRNLFAIARGLNWISQLTPDLAIANSGNVGIGTTGPVVKLHTKGTAALPSNSGAVANGIGIFDGGNSEYLVIGTDPASPYGGWIQVQNANTASTYRPLYLQPNGGNVGIGTTDPQAKLHLLSALPSDAYDIIVQNERLSNDLLAGIALKTVTTADYGRFAILSNGGPNTTTAIIEMYPNDTFTPTARDLLIQTSGYSGSDIILSPAGNVGIGIATPTAKLHVNGNIKAALNNLLTTTPVVYDASASREIGYDIAELFEANEEVEPGDVLSIDENGKLKKSALAYDSRVAGIVSEAPAVLFEGSQLQIAPPPFEFKKGNKPPLALVGRVKCKVTTQDGGPIKSGDLLVTSSKSGYAMKAEPEKLRFGTVLGKALEPLKEGEGKITVLMTLQ